MNYLLTNMIYSIIDKRLGEKQGFNPDYHRLLGDKMVVNENELRKVNDDIEEAAKMLGGVLLTQAEVTNEIRRYRV